MEVDLKNPDIIFNQMTKNISSGIPYTLSPKDGVKLVSANTEMRTKMKHFEEQCDATRRIRMEVIRLFGGEVVLSKQALEECDQKNCALHFKGKTDEDEMNVLYLTDDSILRVGDIVYEPKKNDKKWLVAFVGDSGDACITKVSAETVTKGRIISIEELMKWEKQPRDDIPTAKEMIEEQEKRLKPKSNIILPG